MYSAAFTQTEQKLVGTNNTPVPINGLEHLKDCVLKGREPDVIWKAALPLMERYLTLGTEFDGHYKSAGEKTKNFADVVKILVGQNLVNRLVDLCTDMYVNNRASKNKPIFATICFLASINENTGGSKERMIAARSAAYAFYKNIRNLSHLLELTHMHKTEMKAGTGIGWRNAVNKWFRQRPTDTLAVNIVKYANRNGFTPGDIISMSHPKLTTKTKCRCRKRSTYDPCECAPQQIQNLVAPVTQVTFARARHGLEISYKALIESLGRINPNDPNKIMKEKQAIETYALFCGANVTKNEDTDIKTVIAVIDTFNNFPREFLATSFLNNPEIWYRLFFTYRSSKKWSTAMKRELLVSNSDNRLFPYINKYYPQLFKNQEEDDDKTDIDISTNEVPKIGRIALLGEQPDESPDQQLDTQPVLQPVSQPVLQPVKQLGEKSEPYTFDELISYQRVPLTNGDGTIRCTMPFTALRRNLPKTIHLKSLVRGVTDERFESVVKRLTDPRSLKQGFAHIVDMICAAFQYQQGRGFRGNSTWEVNPLIKDALWEGVNVVSSMERPFKFSDKNAARSLRFIVDTSGSMTTSGTINGLEQMNSIQALTALIVALHNSIKNATPGNEKIFMELGTFVGWGWGNSDKIKYVDLSDMLKPNTTFNDLSGSLTPYSGGSTDLSCGVNAADQSLRQCIDEFKSGTALGNELRQVPVWMWDKVVNTFIIGTDNELNSGSPVDKALSEYQKTYAEAIRLHPMGNDRKMTDPLSLIKSQVPKIIVLSTEGNTSMVADPHHPHILQLSGFDGAVPGLIMDFLGAEPNQ